MTPGAVLFEVLSSAASSSCLAMPSMVRRSRVWPFLAMAMIFRVDLVDFCGMRGSSAPDAHQRSPNSALRIRDFWRSEEPMESSPDINAIGIQEVSRWLHGLGLKKYDSKFRKHHVDGLLLANLTDEDLQEIGVDKGIDRKRIITIHHSS